MAYYHVILHTRNNNRETVIFRNINERKLKSNFVKPYLKAQDLMLENGTLIKNNDIDEIKISKTQKKLLQELQDYKKRKDSSGEKVNFPFDTYIKYLGDDVTSKYITHPPKNKNLTLKVLKHPAFIALLSGAIGFFTNWYFFNC